MPVIISLLQIYNDILDTDKIEQQEDLFIQESILRNQIAPGVSSRGHKVNINKYGIVLNDKNDIITRIITDLSFDDIKSQMINATSFKITNPSLPNEYDHQMRRLVVYKNLNVTHVFYNCGQYQLFDLAMSGTILAKFLIVELWVKNITLFLSKRQGSSAGFISRLSKLSMNPVGYSSYWGTYQNSNLRIRKQRIINFQKGRGIRLIFQCILEHK